ncbi:hypothetical protein F7R20_26360 [Pseudomonas brassicacearum subsp. brassicacearum]|nr:hypothetical protein F7R20_26360 [Pseudomonas brassicacearum subsp. brassicacearum]PJH86332.1 hypothetical protein CVG87_25045 [Pseudomonas sp. WCS365]QEO79267.1 hypothetical protein ELZ14_17520 [Pseudomonas brassicacearum]
MACTVTACIGRKKAGFRGDASQLSGYLWEQGLPAMNDIAVQLLNRGVAIAGKPCSHRPCPHR